MKLSLASLLAVCNLLVVTAQENSKHKYPIGISLGATHLTAAYYNSSDDLVIIGKVEASPAYQKFYSDIVVAESQKPKPVGFNDHAQNIINFGSAINTTEIESIFTDALLSIKARCDEVLGEERRIASIVIPSSWRYEPELRKAIWAAGEKALGFIRPGWQTQSFILAARSHYGLQDGGVDLWDSTERTELLFVVVESESGYLRVRVVESDRGVDEVFFDGVLMDPGEGVFNASLEESRVEDYTTNLEFALENAVQELDIELLDGIIISGEASATAQAHLQTVLRRALPSPNESKILNSTDPFYLGAAGAAHWSRQLYNNFETMFSDWGTSHCCFNDPEKELCYYETQEYRDEVTREKRQISGYFGLPDGWWPKSYLYP